MSQHPERFHALDATRAFALLLGVVFHAAWFFTLEPLGTAVKDVQANHFLSWFFHSSHTFRMQVFYLIAGFFGRLVYQRRGFKVFAVNRVKRILVPLVVAWLVLIPLIVATWVWGRNVSGQNPEDIPPFLAGIGVMVSGAIFVPRSAGGGFSLAHLWFLYYLLLFYVLMFVGRVLALRLGLASGRSLDRTDRLVSWLASSPLGAIVFALLLAPVVWSMTGWFGVDTPAFSPVPSIGVTLVYFSFFLFGWLMHRQAHRLGEFFRRWPIYLGAGMILSVGLYVFFVQVRPYESALPAHSVTYRDVDDWPAFGQSLAAGSGRGEDAPALGQLWAALTPRMREFATATETSVDQRIGLLMAVNGILSDPDYLTDSFRESVSLTEPRKIDLSVIREHREEVQPYLRGVAASDYRLEDWYRPTKFAYSVLYSLTMVLLVFACLGAFQASCQRFSATWRYLADSSYWVYLIHIPLVPALEVLIFRWPVTSWIKFPLLCGVSLLLLYASYHYLARSSFIGKMLNGRKYPFHWNPIRAIRPPRDS